MKSGEIFVSGFRLRESNPVPRRPINIFGIYLVVSLISFDDSFEDSCDVFVHVDVGKNKWTIFDNNGPVSEVSMTAVNRQVIWACTFVNLCMSLYHKMC